MVSASSQNEIEQLHKNIIASMSPPMLIDNRFPDWIIGFIGERGDCKSVSAAKIAIRDGMLRGKSCYSNMHIKIKVIIEDEHPACKYYGIPGGEIVYESQELDKKALFQLDERYQKAIIFADEINLEMAEARRSTSNVNLNLNKVGQEIRHLGLSLIYTVIDEMWVDARIRQLTDIFIRSSDISLDPENIFSNMRPGLVARWRLYPLTRRFNGVSYRDTGESIGPYYIPVRDMWDVYDTHELQATEDLKYGQYMHQKGNIEITPNPEIEQEVKDWGWLDKYAEKLKAGEYLIKNEVWNDPAFINMKVAKAAVTQKFKENYPGLKINPTRKTINSIEHKVWVADVDDRAIVVL